MESTNILTKKQVDQRTAGGISYIRTKGNQVMGLAVNKKKNPKAPNIITVSNKGGQIIKKAELLANCGHPVPLYLKLSKNQWFYKGEYIVERYSTELQDIQQYHGNRPESEIHGILFLKKI